MGADVCSEATAVELTQSYKVFADESRNIDPTYAPKTVNIDGWEATRIAFTTLFFGAVIIRCFLHAFIKVRDCSKTLSSFRELCIGLTH